MLLENLDGISVLRYALERTRLRVFTGDELISTHDVLGMGSFCAQKGGKAACIIDESGVEALEYLSEIHNSHNTTILVIVMGNGISNMFMHKIRAYNLPTFLPYSLISLVNMVKEGALYSEVKKVPCVIYVPKLLMMAMTSFEKSGLCRDLTSYAKQGFEEAEDVIYDIESRCIKITGRGDVVILTSGYAYPIVRHLVTSKHICICNVEMVNPFIVEAVPPAKRYILAGPLATYFDEYFPNAEVIEPSANPMLEGENIKNSLKRLLDGKKYVGYEKLRTKCETLKVKRPDVPKRDNSMCYGCSLRSDELKILEKEGIKSENAYEDIHCEVLGTQVSSGAALAKNFYSADIIFTNQRKEKYNPEKVRWLDARCVRGSDLSCDISCDKGGCL